jgi:membrane protein DedA with SNARE-associated domain
MELLNELVAFFSGYGYWAVFGILLACGFGLPVPEDISLVAGGVISGLGYANVHIMFLVGMAGVMIGDSAVFLIGQRYGERALKFRIIARVLKPETIEKVREKFQKYGVWVVFVGRFMPGLRMPIYFSAGTSGKITFLRFFTTDFTAALVSVPIWVYLGYFGAGNFDELMTWVRQSQITVLVAIVSLILIIITYFTLKRKFSKRI